MQRVIAIFGPTGSGKSSLALEWARARNGELVACDAVMVYRGFDLGSNKPSAEERALVPHHLLDVVEPAAPFTAADYARAASRAVAEVLSRGKVPIIVVGTFLYYRALVYGLAELPSPSPSLRAELAAREAAEPGWLAREVERVDRESFLEAKGKNLPRLVRALEIHRLTGTPASALRAAHGFRSPAYAVTRVGLSPPRPQLIARIRARAERMLGAGWAQEVRGLLARGTPEDAKPMQAVGYRQVAAAVLRGEAVDLEAIIIATQQYAKRQLTFFAKEPSVRWHESFGEALVSLPWEEPE